MTTLAPSLTENQSKILRTVAEFLGRGESPTLRQLAGALSLAGPSSVQPQLEAIEKKGYLRVVGGARGRQLKFQLTPKAEYSLPELVRQCRFPLMVDIPCGPLEEIISDLADTDWFNPGDCIKTYPDSWFARAKGKSMAPRFEPGDIIHFRRELQWQNGDLCAVQVYRDKSESGECSGTFKRIHLQDNERTLVLEAINPAYRPLIVDREFCKIVGVHRKGVIRGSDL